MNNLTLTLDDLSAILHAIRYNKSLPLSTMHEYLLSHNIISQDMPPPLCDYHVSAWLIQIILREYKCARERYNLNPIEPTANKIQLLQQIHADYQTFDKDLEAWSVLFVRYACHIATIEHVAAAQMTQRTLRRRQKRGIELLYVQILLD